MYLFSKENIWSNPHASSIHPVIQTSTIILWSELFPKKRREKIQGEILQSIFEYRIQWCFHIQSIHSTRTTVFPHAIQQLQVSTVNSMYRINSSTRNTTTTRLIPCHPMQIITRHLPATAPMHPSILSGSIHAAPYNSSQDTPKTTCPWTIQGYKSSPGHSPKTTHSRNTGQDSLLRQLVPGQHRAGLSKIIHPKTYQQDIWCFRTIGPRTGIVTQLVPRHINKIYGVPRQQDNQSQDRNHYVQNSTRIHFKRVKYCISMQY